MKIDDMRDENGKLPFWAWPGGYPIYYVTTDGGILCPKCANECTPDKYNADQFTLFGADINWEDPNLFCDHCNDRIESAYAEDEEETDQ